MAQTEEYIGDDATVASLIKSFQYYADKAAACDEGTAEGLDEKIDWLKAAVDSATGAFAVLSADQKPLGRHALRVVRGEDEE